MHSLLNYSNPLTILAMGVVVFIFVPFGYRWRKSMLKRLDGPGHNDERLWDRIKQVVVKTRPSTHTPTNLPPEDDPNWTKWHHFNP
jgi:hypothetical protein